VIQAESVSFPADLSSLFNKVDNTAQNDIVSGGYVFIHQNVIDTARNCEFCTVIEYSPNASNKAFDVAWNSAQKYNISNAKKLTFFAMGGNGDESVSFKSLGKTKFDINSKPTNERTFGLTTTPTTLEKTWKKFEIDLSGKDLRGTDSPFAVSILKPNTNEVSAVYVKDLELDNTPVQPENDNAVRLDEATQLR
jgi:flagellin-like hook-associated protein FlgL